MSGSTDVLGVLVLDEELKTAMRLLGAHDIGELGLQHVSTKT